MAMKSTRPTNRARCLVDIVRQHTDLRPERLAYRFYAEDGNETDLSWGELDIRARAIAARLGDIASPGDRAALVFPPGLDFATAFLGCLYAGVVAVPAYPPDPARLQRTLPRLQAILADAGASLLLAPRLLLNLWPKSGLVGAPQTIATDEISAERADDWAAPTLAPDDVAFLQYTSGSTASPRGVVIRHRNLIASLEYARTCFGHGPESTICSWLPLYHDFGLVGGMLQTLYIGTTSYLMSPLEFLRTPIRWLERMSTTRATTGGGPNFAYALCARRVTDAELERLDLSHWRVAVNGAEPVLAATLDRFCARFERCGFGPETFVPCYGLAESTLIVTGAPFGRGPRGGAFDPQALASGVLSSSPSGRRLVGSGLPAHPEVEVRIVDPDTCEPLPDGQVGEIWVRSPANAAGYWQQPKLTEDTFAARLGREPGSTTSDAGPYLRTGDLGAIADQELYVTGRIKDLIIVHGANHYPQDLEQLAESAEGLLRPGCSAAFTIAEHEHERVVLVAEVRPAPGYERALERVRSVLAAECGLVLDELVFIEARSIAKTSSGKIQRGATRAALLDGRLPVIASWRRASSPAASVAAASPTERLILELIATALERPADEIDRNAPFVDLGLDSVRSVELAAGLSDRLGIELAATILWDHPSVRRLAEHLDGVAPRARPAGGRRAEAGEPIAIVGLGCRFPGAADPRGFWRLLLDGVDAITEVPASRWEVERWFDANPAAPGRINSRWGGFLADVVGFDPEAFGLSLREARSMDPQHRVALELAFEALDDAGIDRRTLAGSDTGVYLGVGPSEYANLLLANPDQVDGYTATGSFDAIAANRLSYLLDLRGPSITLGAVCSSSLLAIHTAAEAIRSGACSRALAGGVTLLLTPNGNLWFSKLGVLSPTGRCRAYGEAADGIVLGEGGGIVVLEPLSVARANKDRILAVIRGGAVVQDGRSNGLVAPSTRAQVELLEAAYRHAGVDPARVRYVEGHGTGTVVGDPVEVQALAQVIGQANGRSEPCRLGSVKSNIGHLSIAGGVAGCIKVALALHHRQIPRSLHCEAPNPHLVLADRELALQHSTTAWPDGPEGPWVAGVTSLSFGGTNVHVVLEQELAPAPAEVDDGPRAIVLSADTRTKLDALSKAWADWLRRERPSLAAAAVTAARRTEGRWRRAVVATSSNAAAMLLDDADGSLAGQAPLRILFVYSGLGAHWWGMGRELTAPVFRRTIAEIDRHVRELGGWSVSEALAESEATTRIGEVEIGQVTTAAIQIALTAQLAAWGVVPDGVVGHSAGEIACAWAGGILSLPDAMRVAIWRGRLQAPTLADGGVLAVGASLERIRAIAPEFERDLDVAAYNGPDAHSLSGTSEDLKRLALRLGAAGIACKLLPVVPSHGRLMIPVARELVRALDGLAPKSAQRRVYATAEGDDRYDPAYWGRNVAGPVRFADAIRRAFADGYDAVLEIGPEAVLLPAIASLVDPRTQLLPTLQPGAERAQILSTLARTWCAGHPVRWPAIHDDVAPVSAPSVPWQRRPVWIDDPSHHRQLGPVARDGNGWCWPVRLCPGDQPELGDHRIGGRIVLAGAAQLELVLAAAIELFGAGPHQLRDVLFQAAVWIPDDHELVLQLRFTPDSIGCLRFELVARAGEVHTHGAITLNAWRDAPTIVPLDDDLPVQLDGRDFYERIQAHGGSYGPAFRSLRELRRRHDRAIGIHVPELPPARGRALPVVALDGLIQVALAAADAGARVPVALASLRVHGGLAGSPSDGRRCAGRPPLALAGGPPSPKHASHAWGRFVSRVSLGDHGIESAVVTDETGAVLLEVDGVRLEHVRLPRDSDRWWYRTELEDVPVEGEPDGFGTWLVAATEPFAAAIAQALERIEGRCVRVRPGDELRETAPDQFTVDPTRTDHWQALLDRFPDCHAVVHAWALHEPPAATPSAGLRLGCAAVIRILDAARRCGRTPRLWVVTGPDQPVTAPLLGLCRVIAQERPELSCTHVRLGSPALEQVDALARELAFDEPISEVVLDGRRRGSTRLVRCPVPSTTAWRCAAGRTWLITGGLGGLGLVLARWAAARGASRLVLVGRRPPTDAALASIRELQRDESTVEVRAVDVTVEAELAQLITEIEASDTPLGGVIHAAATFDDALLDDCDELRLTRVMAAKADGAALLDRLTRKSMLDAFIMMSSASAVLGLPGQAAYAAANASLDSLARARKTAGLPALSIGWGVWGDDGAVRRTSGGVEALRSRGLRPMASAAALDALDRALAFEQDHVVIMDVDWYAFARSHPALEGSSLLAPVAAEAVERQRPELDGLVVAELAPAQQHELLQAYVVRRLGRILAIRDQVPADGSRSLLELGLSSLGALELTNWIHQDFGIDLSPAVFLSGTTLDELVGVLRDQIVGAARGSSRPPIATLPDDLRATGQAAPLPARRLLLTGATGFLGAHLLARLLARPNLEVICAVRAADEAHGLERVARALDTWQLGPLDRDRVGAVLVDLGAPNLGLSADAARQLNHRVDAILHSGALVNFVFRYEDLEATNVTGTTELIRLACLDRTLPIHFVSSAAVLFFGGQRGRVSGEDDDIEQSTGFLTGYQVSKWAAERVLGQARERGVPVSIYRPPWIEGDSARPVFNPADFLCTLVRVCVRIGEVPDVEMNLNVVPIDFAAEAIVHVALAQPPGRNYHVTNPAPLRWSTLVAAVERATGSLNRVPFGRWLATVSSTSRIDPDPGLAMVLGVIGSEARLPLVSGAPDYRCDNLLAALAADGPSCPAPDDALLDHYVRSWMANDSR